MLVISSLLGNRLRNKTLYQPFEQRDEKDKKLNIGLSRKLTQLLVSNFNFP